VTPSGHLNVCVVGAGPRGLSVLERLCANERDSRSLAKVTVHMVDPSAPGAGTVWRADQSRYLLMNTVATQITVYTDDSARIDGPIEPGPSLYEWAKHLAAEGPFAGADEHTLVEAARLGPDSYPTRAFYGRYLYAGFQRVVDLAPSHVDIQVHRCRAVAIADTEGFADGPQQVDLEDGTRLDGLDAVVLALGHVPTRPSRRQERTARLSCVNGLTYITPANPADLDLSPIKPRVSVLLRGLGLNFFDHMALFTLGRGGIFTRGDDGLVYHPSGKEALLYASSRRGIPYHSRGENEKGAFGRYQPKLVTTDLIADLRSRAAKVRFGTDLWPLISREVESVYYGTLLETLGRAAEREEFARRYLFATDRAELAPLLDEYRIEAADRWNWEQLARPYRGHEFRDRAEFRAWMLDYLRRDVRQARAGNVNGPLKAALDVLRDLRNEIRLAVDHGGVTGDSYRDDLSGWYTPFNAFLSIGPPASRIEEMIALMESGILELTGPDTEIRIDTDEPAFVARSTTVPGPPVRASVLIEARLPEPDLRRTADPLLRNLMATGQCSPFEIAGPCGTSYETGGLAVTERPYRLVDADGEAHPRRFAYGVPTEFVHWVTAAGIRPGVDSVTLGDSDSIARTVLRLSPVADRPAGEWQPAEAGDYSKMIV
jgi:uncharacterized NAD(P)/FAD-binding protein YdhS